MITETIKKDVYNSRVAPVHPKSVNLYRLIRLMQGEDITGTEIARRSDAYLVERSEGLRIQRHRRAPRIPEGHRGAETASTHWSGAKDVLYFV